MKLKSVKIKIGDLFKVLNIDNQKYEESQTSKFDVYIRTPSNEIVLIDYFVKKHNNNIISVKLDNGIEFKCSENHLIQNELGETQKVKDAGSLFTTDGIEKIISKQFEKVGDVYDISIPFPHLYITPNKVIHHNTYLGLEALKNAQEKGYFAVLYDSEMANNDKEVLKSRGINTEQLLFIPIDTVENLKTSVLNIIEEVSTTDKVIIMVDSIGNLSTRKELEDSLEGLSTKDMTRPAQLKALFRTMTLKAGVKHIPVIVVNHVYANIGGFFSGGNTIAGGGGSLYNSSIIASFTKAQEKDKEGKMSGALVTSTVTKCRTAKEKTKVKFTIDFDNGLSLYSGLELWCTEQKLITKEGRSFIFTEKTKFKQGEKFSKITDELWDSFLNAYLYEYLHETFAYTSVSEDLGLEEEVYED